MAVRRTDDISLGCIYYAVDLTPLSCTALCSTISLGWSLVPVHSSSVHGHLIGVPAWDETQCEDDDDEEHVSFFTQDLSTFTTAY